MSRFVSFPARFTLAALLVVGGAATAVAPSAASAATTMRLAGDVLPHLSSYTDLGAASAQRQVQVDVTIARPNPVGEQALYQALYTPGNALYHHFLTPAQFDLQFGVAQATYNAVRSFATAKGLTVANTVGSRDLIVLDGTIAQVQNTFAVSIHDFQSGGRSFYANVAGPAVPAGLSISGVVGLNNKLGMTRYSNGPDNPVPSGATHGTAPAQTGCTATACTGLMTPRNLWSVYKQPGGASANPINNKTVDFGQGQKMAVFGEGQTDPVITNLRTFERLNKLPQVPISVVHADGSHVSYSDNAGEVEWDLDTQASTGMAPDVLSEVLYFGHDLSDQSVLNVFNTWADDSNGPLQANASYGECEENPIGDAVGSTPGAFSSSQMFTLGSESTLLKANMEGRTLFSSAGDTGSSCPLVAAATLNGLTNSVVPIVNYPASSPHAVDVGGTVLYASDTSVATRVLEYSWTYTGGGTSFVFAKPTYQNGITQIGGACTSDPGGGTTGAGKPCRGAPDVAALSGDVSGNGYAIVAQGQSDYPGGGTSLSSPLWMGMWTRVQAAAPKVRGTFAGNGFANPALYAQYKSAHSAEEFFDIGGGASSPPAGNGFYVSTPGWDYVSGMGTPNVEQLARLIDGTARPSNPVLPKYPPAASSTRTNACTPLFTDPAGDDDFLAGSNPGGNPQLDLLSANISLNASGNGLRVVTRIRNLSKAAASAVSGTPGVSPASDYYVLWTYGGVSYFAGAEVDTTTGAVTYDDGTVSGTQYTTAHKTDAGSFTTGANGRIEVDVPLTNVGTPTKGAVLTAPGAQTRVLVGTTQTGGLIELADSGGPKYDYVVGQKCSSI